MQAFKILLVGSEEQHNAVKLSDYTTQNTQSIHRSTKSLTEVVKNLSGCNLIVTLSDWESDEKSTKIIQIARIIGITVIHHSRFKDYVQANNN